MKAKPMAGELLGYRLPSDGEWEYACRAGAITSRYYGLSEPLLVEYAWTFANGKNRTWPVGCLKPNDWGLFDMLGNACEWTHEPFVAYFRGTERTPFLDSFNESPVLDNNSRVLRGGTFLTYAQFVRSAYRADRQPMQRYYYYAAFRVARTTPP